MALASLDIPTIGSKAIAIAQVVLVNSGQEHTYVGSALSDEDPRAACVRSVLDAINRVFPRLKR